MCSAVDADAIGAATIQVGGKELAVRPVESDIADTGIAVGADRGKQRERAGQPIDLPDGAGAATVLLGKLTRHEMRIRGATPLALREQIVDRSAN